MATRIELLAEVDQLLHRQNFTKEDSSRAEALLRLADQLTDRSELRGAVMRQRDVELGNAPRLIRTAPDAQFMAYLRRGPEALDLETRRRIGSEKSRPPIRGAEGIGTGAGGGYIVPQSFADRFEVMLRQTDGLFALATTFETGTGTPTNYPMVEDTSNVATIVPENNPSVAGPDLAFAALAFGSTNTWRSGMIRASVELAQDSKFDLEALVAASAAVRVARGVGAAFVATLLASAGLGIMSASDLAIAPDELWQLQDAIDPAYLQNGSWLMTRATFSQIMRLKTSTAAYIFPERFDPVTGRPLLLSAPVYYSPSMPAAMAGLKPILFGDLSKFVRRQVRGSLQVKVLVERYAEFGQLGYETYLRVDGQLLQSSTTVPIKYLAMHA